MVWKLETEYDNLRAALAWSQGPAANQEFRVRLVAALAEFWRIRGYYDEAKRWCAAVLEHSPAAAPARMAALLGAGWLAIEQFDMSQAQEYGAEALTLVRTYDDRPAIGSALRTG
jgi:hypothetical protein